MTRYHHLAGACVAAVALAGAVLIIAANLVGPRRVPSPPVRDPAPGVRMEGVRTSAYLGPDRQLSASARWVRVAPLRMIGPFRIGIMRSITASEVEIDLGGDASDRTSESGSTISRRRSPRFSLPCHGPRSSIWS